MDIYEAIKGRRAIRRYKDDPVKDSDIEEILEAARWAPSCRNNQCWRFIIVKDKNLKQKLTESLSSVNKSVDAIANAPVVIVACAQRGESGCNDEGKPTTNKGDWWFMYDMGLAMQNLYLAAYGKGLGTVNVAGFNANKVAEILNVPQNIEVICMTPLGYPDEQPRPPGRKNLSELVFKE